MEVEEFAPIIYEDDGDDDNNRNGLDHLNNNYDNGDHDTEEEEDEPVIVPYDEVEALNSSSHITKNILYYMLP